MEADRRTVGGIIVCRLNLVGAQTVGRPLNRLRSAAARKDFDLVRNHKRRIETDAELPDEFGRIRLVLDRLQEPLGAGAGNGAEVLFDFLSRHADAVIGNGERIGFRIGDNLNRIVGVARLSGIGETLKAGAVDGVGRVRNQFPQEDLFLGIEGVNDEIEQLADLGLKRFFHRKNVLEIKELKREMNREKKRRISRGGRPAAPNGAGSRAASSAN